ncbi:MAG: hypothetical protein IKS80_03450 [Bacteroidaceae bacterium]|nr:hypothetical protein [Bacteroidaceae bacterium]MBR5962812.1 hypothetical protein [Bacteroidaceae bacterium]
MKRLRRYLPFLTLLLLAAGVTSCGLPPTPSERKKSREVREPVQVAESSKARVESAWKDSVWLWPLAGYEPGEGILKRPNERIGKWKNPYGLFLTAPEGTPVLCPEDATVRIMGLFYHYPWSRPIARAAGVPVRDRTFEEASHDLDSNVEKGEIDPKYISGYVSLNIDSREIRLTGFMRERGLPQGTRLHRGDTIGTLHYGYCAFDEPNLFISVEQFNQLADPMSPFGIPSTFVAPKRQTAEQIIMHRAVWIAAPVLVIALVLFVIFRLRDRRRIAYFRRLKEEMMASPVSSSEERETSPQPSPEGKAVSWTDAYRQRIAACTAQFWTMPSAQYLQAAIEDEAYMLTAEQGAAVTEDIRTAFRDIANDIRRSSVKVNNDEVLFCLLSTLRLPTSVMAKCLYVTDSTLRGRKTRLKAKMPEELFNLIFQS